MRSLFKTSLFFSLLFVSVSGFSRNYPDTLETPSDHRLINEDIEVVLPAIIIEGIDAEIQLKFRDPEHPILIDNDNVISMMVDGISQDIHFEDGVGIIKCKFITRQSITIESGEFQYEVFVGGHERGSSLPLGEGQGGAVFVNPIPLWLSIFPPLIAILMALVFREVISSLFLGIFFGAAIIGFYSDGFVGIFSGLLAVIDTYIINSINDWSHLAIIIFSMAIGAIVSVISRNGGMQGVVDKISRYAKDAKSGQLVTWLLGIAIFFDDYANTLVVGNTMRPITDKLKISREKLSYLVDSTAAPVAAIAFVTTWIGAQLGYIEKGIQGIGIKEGAYSVFLNSLQYSFYPVLTLAFMLMLILKGRDFGAMYKAEVRARTTGRVTNSNNEAHNTNNELAGLQPVEGSKHKWYNAVIPIAIVIFGTIIGLFYTGWSYEVWNSTELSFSRKLSAIIGASDSYYALLWSSLCGLLMAILLTLGQRIMSLTDTIEAALKGFKTMLPAIMILILAWSLALVTEHLHTADFITGALLSGGVDPMFIPAVTFILASLIAFATGSSWGTMAILYPLMLPAAWQLCQVSGYDYNDSMMIFYNVVSCVLAGSVLGDHCSPISDTTILSSLASSCNHIDHVRTQLPYALTVGGVAILFGTIPGAMGVSSLITFPLGLIALYLIVSFVGKKVEIIKVR